MDTIGHGTVAGTVAANNNLGVIRVAPTSPLGREGIRRRRQGTMEDVIKASTGSSKKKAEGGRWVFNISAGGTQSSTAEGEAFARVIAEGVIIVASSGNESKPSTPAAVNFPAAYPDVIAVGAVDEQNLYIDFSNLGPELDFVAPGVSRFALAARRRLPLLRPHDGARSSTRDRSSARSEAVTGSTSTAGSARRAISAPRCREDRAHPARRRRCGQSPPREGSRCDRRGDL
jgi:hypothetical protein